jgi:hypothetical protein
LLESPAAHSDEILSKEGFDGLFARMGSKIEELRKTGNAVAP